MNIRMITDTEREQAATITHLEGEATVMRGLLRLSLGTLSTLEGESEEEEARLCELRAAITKALGIAPLIPGALI